MAEPIVPAHHRLKDNAAYQATHAGRLLVTEFKCAACHEIEGHANSESKSAPNLSNVTSRAKAKHLQQFVLDPHGTKPGTKMPDVVTDTKDAEAIVHFLASINPQEIPQGYANFGGGRRGKKLFDTVGCIVCHGPSDKDDDWPGAVPLGNLEAKYTLPALAEFVRNPLHARPSGRMPSLNLTGREAADIATFLLPSVPEKAGIEFAYYELDNPDRLPDFEKLTPTKTGTTSSIDLGKHAARRERFGLRYSGILDVTEPGKHEFSLGSDDGSRLLIDGKVVIDNDGTHGMERKKTTTDLKAGRHTVEIEYFERDGGEELEALFQPPNGERQPLATAMVSSSPQEPLEDLSFSVDQAKAAKGKALFTSLGCAACHEVGQALPAIPKAPALAAATDTSKGCLATSATPANYQLSDEQRTTLAKHIKNKPAKLTPEQEIQHTMLQFNCVACHQRGELGGVEQRHVPFFETTQKEMGVEGSIPPHLNGVGAKLTLPWLEKLLAEGAKDRPYMLTKMPKFGTNNVGHLAKQLATVDKMESLAEVSLDRKEAKKVGHRLVGEKGFSCIKCHTFGRHKATGVQSIDMTIMTKRLRPDWFRSYIRNPQIYRKGTRMPSAWPVEGKSYLPDLLDGDSDKQIAAVWTYLKDGNAARTPSGLATGTKELIPIDEAIIYRNFIQGAGARAIGVGYPDGLHLAFDANDLRLALIWKGAFMNAQRHWTGRGQGYEPPAGQDVRQLAEGIPIATLSSADAVWPSQSARELENYKFKGYQLTPEQFPTFHYQIAGLTVNDTTLPKQTDVSTTFKRTLTITGNAKPNTFLRLATGKISNDGKQFDVGDGLKIAITQSAQQPLIRKSDGSDELLIPLLGDQPMTVVLEYSW